MARSFHRYQSSVEARQAFVEAEAVTSLAHQIRVLRTQRGWSQADLAREMGTTQAAVSRMEDASYGRISFKTMLNLARVFDVAPVMRFMSTIQLLRERRTVRRADLEVRPFNEEAKDVVFETAERVGSAMAATLSTSVPDRVHTVVIYPNADKPAWLTASGTGTSTVMRVF